MADLVFDCLDIAPRSYAAAPTLAIRLRISETSAHPIDAIALRCQIRIQPQRRRYAAQEADRLADLFGDTDRWAETLKPLQFTNVSTMVPRFSGSIEVDLEVPCTYDLEVAAPKYFHSLDEGEVPLLLLFSGTVFTRDPGGSMAVDQVPWDREAEYRMPVRVWRELMDMYFPSAGWLRLQRETLDALGRFKSQESIPTWDATMQALLERVGQVTR